MEGLAQWQGQVLEWEPESYFSWGGVGGGGGLFSFFILGLDTWMVFCHDRARIVHSNPSKLQRSRRAFSTGHSSVTCFPRWLRPRADWEGIGLV